MGFDGIGIGLDLTRAVARLVLLDWDHSSWDWRLTTTSHIISTIGTWTTRPMERRRFMPEKEVNQENRMSIFYRSFFLVPGSANKNMLTASLTRYKRLNKTCRWACHRFDMRPVCEQEESFFCVTVDLLTEVFQAVLEDLKDFTLQWKWMKWGS